MSTLVEVVRDDAGFARLREEWSALLLESPADTVFLTWEWLHSWWSHAAEGRRLALVAVRRDEKLLALAPLCEGAARLELLGSGQAGSDYLDVIVRRGSEVEALDLLAARLADFDSVLQLRRLREGSDATALAARLGDAGFAVREAAASSCPYVDLRGLSWDGYLASLGPEHRANFRRRLRALERAHAPRFELVATEARRRELLPVLFELHRRRWSERGGSDGLIGPGLQSFHDEASRLALDRGWLRLFVLWLGDAPAASLYCFKYRDVFSFYQSGFDPRFAKLGVGLVALGLAIRSAVLEGALEFDLLHGEEPYKFLWARHTRPLEGITAFPASVHGRLAWGRDAAKDFARLLVRRLPGAERPHAAPAR